MAWKNTDKKSIKRCVSHHLYVDLHQQLASEELWWPTSWMTCHDPRVMAGQMALNSLLVEMIDPEYNDSLVIWADALECMNLAVLAFHGWVYREMIDMEEHLASIDSQEAYDDYSLYVHQRSVDLNGLMVDMDTLIDGLLEASKLYDQEHELPGEDWFDDCNDDEPRAPEEQYGFEALMDYKADELDSMYAD